MGTDCGFRKTTLFMFHFFLEEEPIIPFSRKLNLIKNLCYY